MRTVGRALFDRLAHQIQGHSVRGWRMIAVQGTRLLHRGGPLVVSADVISDSRGDALEKCKITTVPTSAQIEDRLQVLYSSQRCFKILVKRSRDPPVQPLADRCQRRRQSPGRGAFSLSQQLYDLDIRTFPENILDPVPGTHPSAVNVLPCPVP